MSINGTLQEAQRTMQNALASLGGLGVGGGANRVHYGLSHVHYALQVDTDGVITYATPIPMPGAASLSLDPQGSPSVFYADGRKYHVSRCNVGYSGELHLAELPDSFRRDVLEELTDLGTGNLVETAARADVRFALLFQFEGDARATRYAIYNCGAERIQIGSATTAERAEVSEEALQLESAPLPNGIVRVRSTPETDAEAYAGWYDAVWLYTPGSILLDRNGNAISDEGGDVIVAQSARR